MTDKARRSTISVEGPDGKPVDVFFDASSPASKRAEAFKKAKRRLKSEKIGGYRDKISALNDAGEVIFCSETGDHGGCFTRTTSYVIAMAEVFHDYAAHQEVDDK